MCQYFFKQSTAKFRIGAHANSSKETIEIFKGRLGNFSIYKRQLTQFEIFCLNDLNERILSTSPFVGNSSTITNYKSLNDILSIPTYGDILGLSASNYIDEIVLRLFNETGSSVSSINYIATLIDPFKDKIHEVSFDNGSLISTGISMSTFGSPTYSTVDSIDSVTLNGSQYFYFDNNTTAHSSLFSGDFSITFLFRAGTSVADESLFIAKNNSDPSVGLDIQLLSDGTVRVQRQESSSGTQYLLVSSSDSNNFRNSTWNRLFLTSNSTNTTLRINNISNTGAQFINNYGPQNNYMGIGAEVGTSFVNNDLHTSSGNRRFIWYYFRANPGPDEIDLYNYGSAGDNYAFKDATKLHQVTIGANLETIGNSAFNNTSISQIQIRDSVISIGNNAFAIIQVFHKFK